ncbi:MAG: sugar phosphate isomerase/epimerase [Verrucomicrobiota bacterium]
MLSFSTCWNSSRHSDGEELVAEIVEMGFDKIEISHGMKVSLLPGIKKAYEKGMVKVSGVHNFCPSPVEVMIDAPDCYEFTSHRPFERERALKLTLETLEMAKTFGSKYVVLHMGSVPMKRFSKDLTKMVEDGKLNSRAYVKLKLKAIKKREALEPLYFERAREALKQIAVKAEEVRVPVAVESRSAYEDVPSEREMVNLMEEYADNPWVGYWHDFGHVQRKANLSMMDHVEWIEKMSPYLIGSHVHDVEWPARDHRVPMTGHIDYPPLLKHIAPEKPMVWELSPSRRRSQIRKMVEEWRGTYPAWC